MDPQWLHEQYHAQQDPRQPGAQLEHATGAALLCTDLDGIITLTTDDGEFTHDVQPVLETLAWYREEEPALVIALHAAPG